MGITTLSNSFENHFYDLLPAKFLWTFLIFIFCLEIHCMDTPTTKSFSASLRLPIGHASPPVLEHFSTGADGSNSGASPTIGSGVNIGGVANDDSSCTIISGPVPGMYNLELAGRLQGCGVRKCTEQGEEWLCLLVRFPLLKGNSFLCLFKKKNILICFF